MNTPPRGIGDGTMRSVEQLAQERGLSLHDAADRAVAEALVPPKQARNLRVFLDLLRDLHGRVETVPVAELLRGLLREQVRDLFPTAPNVITPALTPAY